MLIVDTRNDVPTSVRICVYVADRKNGGVDARYGMISAMSRFPIKLDA